MATEKGKDLDHLLKKLAADYAKYFYINSNYQEQQIDSELEAILAHLEEYKTSLSQLKNKNCILDQASQISACYQALQSIFQNVDTLENLIHEIRTDLNNVETAVAKAERDLTSGSSISAVFRPFLFIKEPPLTNVSDNPNFTPPEIKFNANKYFTRDDKNVQDQKL